jgi:hypothetical protein
LKGAGVTEEKEVIIFVFATGVLLFILVKRTQLRRIPAGAVLLAGFYSFWFGWGFTVIESLCWQTFFNYLEHVSYLAGSLLIATWSWLVFGKRARSS